MWRRAVIGTSCCAYAGVLVSPNTQPTLTEIDTDINAMDHSLGNYSDLFSGSELYNLDSDYALLQTDNSAIASAIEWRMDSSPQTSTRKKKFKLRPNTPYNTLYKTVYKKELSQSDDY